MQQQFGEATVLKQCVHLLGSSIEPSGQRGYVLMACLCVVGTKNELDVLLQESV